MSRLVRFVLRIFRQKATPHIERPYNHIKPVMSEASTIKLRQLGYAFNKAGELRKVDEATNEPGEEPFQFDVYGNHEKNQEHYEQLAELIPEIVYDLLEKCGLKRTYVPPNIPQQEATFIFTQPEILNKSRKLLVLIHGSGYVRAGQWARSLIINNSMDHGTQIPYIKRAQELGYDILVMNTNDNYRLINGVRKSIPQVGTPSDHAKYVWKNFVMASEPDNVAIVAHSYGGSLTMELADKYPKFFEEKVFAVALTDSAHFSIPKKGGSVLKDITCNWVSHSESLDTPVSSALYQNAIRRVSAGHSKHEWTSWAAFESVFKFLEQKFKDRDPSTAKKAKLSTSN